MRNEAYTATGTLLELNNSQFSVTEGTLTNGMGCRYVAGTGIVADQNYLTESISSSWASASLSSSYPWLKSGDNLTNTDSNVGIRTNAPSYALDVHQNARVTGSVILGTSAVDANHTAYVGANGKFRVSRHGEENLDFETTPNAIFIHANAGNKSLIIQNDNNQNINFVITGSNIMALSSSGNVGVGIATPTSKLEVAGNVSAVTYTSSVSANNVGFFGTASWAKFSETASYSITSFVTQSTNIQSSASWASSSISASHALVSNTSISSSYPWIGSGTDSYLANGINKVGIGTTSPATTLHVSSSSTQLRLSKDTAYADLVVDNNFYFGSVTSGYNYLNRSGDNFLFVYSASKYSIINGNYIALSDNVMWLGRNGGWFDGGSFGIGTSAIPTHKLHVSGTVYSSDGYYVSASSLTGLTSTNGTSWMYPLDIYGNMWLRTAGAKFNDAGAHYWRHTDGTYWMELANGNLGVFCGSGLGARLNVSASQYNNGILVTGNSNAGIGISLQNSEAGAHKYALYTGGTGNSMGAGAFGIFDETINNQSLTITADGSMRLGNNYTTPTLFLTGSKAGIGTITPGTTLHVQGNISASSITASLLGTASWANNTISASHALTAISAAYATNANFATSTTFAATSNTANSATSASHALVANSAATANWSNYATSAISATSATSASHTLNADNAISSAFALSASWAPSSGGGTTLYTGSTYSITSSWANNVISASHALTAISAAYATNANFATSTTFAATSNTANSATSASHALNADTVISAAFATSAGTATNAHTATSASHTIVSDQINVLDGSGGEANAYLAFIENNGATNVYLDSSLRYNPVNVTLTVPTIVSTLTGTSSWANNAISASFAIHTISSSHALKSNTATSASHALDADDAITASFAIHTISSSHALAANIAVSSSHALSADTAISASYAPSSGGVSGKWKAGIVSNASFTISGGLHMVADVTFASAFSDANYCVTYGRTVIAAEEHCFVTKNIASTGFTIICPWTGGMEHNVHWHANSIGEY